MAENKVPKSIFSSFCGTAANHSFNLHYMNFTPFQQYKLHLSSQERFSSFKVQLKLQFLNKASCKFECSLKFLDYIILLTTFHWRWPSKWTRPMIPVWPSDDLKSRILQTSTYHLKVFLNSQFQFAIGKTTLITVKSCVL